MDHDSHVLVNVVIVRNSQTGKLEERKLENLDPTLLTTLTNKKHLNQKENSALVPITNFLPGNEDRKGLLGGPVSQETELRNVMRRSTGGFILRKCSWTNICLDINH